MVATSLVRSQSLVDYLQNRREVTSLLNHAPDDKQQFNDRKKHAIAQAIFKGCVVLICSQLEGYYESIIIEVVDAMNRAKPANGLIPVSFRLNQIEKDLQTAYQANNHRKKVAAIRKLLHDYQWFGDDSNSFDKFTGEMLTAKISSPDTKEIAEVFSQLGIADISNRAAGKDLSRDRGALVAKIKELVERRHEIAHSARTSPVQLDDVRTYSRCALKLAVWTDRVVGEDIHELIGVWPW